MANLALSRFRKGEAAAIAEDRELAALRRTELLLGPTPTDAALQAEAAAAAGSAAAVAAAAAEDARNANVMMTSSGRRIKVSHRDESSGCSDRWGGECDPVCFIWGGVHDGGCCGTSLVHRGYLLCKCRRNVRVKHHCPCGLCDFELWGLSRNTAAAM
jgi:hypothetical protein